MPAMPAEAAEEGAAAAADAAPVLADPPRKKTKRAKAAAEEKEERTITFRNYTPRTTELKDHCLPRITSAEIEADIDDEIEALLAAAEDQDAVLAVAPRKPNWDLKRDVERKMQTLQARTDRAVVQLIRRRIQENKAPPKTEAGAANPDDERGERDEASMALAREVAKAGPHAGVDSDDDAA
eukprot:TRINITY_DN58306_c0_g1_i1.p2 TRINITY_DN58306_c0_g1~~TRINITY_DN58306_c0_g1_i1.p2  ORF type:complete len:182 (-),score=53.49 TRINITY_DN58306_c0_g1_i1:49-594(-)